MPDTAGRPEPRESATRDTRQRGCRTQWANDWAVEHMLGRPSLRKGLRDVAPLLSHRSWHQVILEDPT